MDIISYSLSKKIAASAVSGVKNMSVEGQTLKIVTNTNGTLTMTFPKPRDGVSVTDIDVNANNQIVFTMSDGSEFISGKIPTVKGDAGFSPTITENADNTDKIYKLDITTADSTFTTPNLKGTGTGGSGEENIIDSISVNGVNVAPDENKNVDITVPNIYVGDAEPIDDNMEVWFNPNGESSSIPQGIQGPQGERGLQGEIGPQGEKGEKGDAGESAYEIAVRYGFSGTEEEWINSITNPPVATEDIDFASEFYI